VILLENGQLHLRTHVGFSRVAAQTYEAAFPRPVDNSTVVGRAIIARGAVYIPDFTADPVIWLLRHLKPDFKTIADFRRDNRNAFRPIFRQFVLLCRQLDLFGRELLAVDGTRIKAVNNKDRNFTRNSLETFIRAADERLVDYLRRLDEGDVTEDGTSGGARTNNHMAGH
jgi:hypothetical protein